MFQKKLNPHYLNRVFPRTSSLLIKRMKKGKIRK